MKISDLEDWDKLVTKDYLEMVLARFENKMIERFNALEAKINGLEAKINAFEAKINGLDGRLNNQRTLLIVAIIGIVAQIINAWVLHK